jgi:hypothetical protein
MVHVVTVLNKVWRLLSTWKKRTSRLMTRGDVELEAVDSGHFCDVDWLGAVLVIPVLVVVSL